jgi:hypothetical protein
MAHKQKSVSLVEKFKVSRAEYIAIVVILLKIMLTVIFIYEVNGTVQ